MVFWYLLIGAIVSGPVWIAVSIIASRRIWRNVRKLSRRAKGREQLVELGQLAGGLAHEIKNPLSTINVNLKLLTEDLRGLGGQEHHRLRARLGSVQEEADRLNRILEDFLQFAGKYELSLHPADLRKVIEELADFFAAQADKAGVIMRTTLPPTPVICDIDAALIKQALLNLMINAVQAIPGGGELLIKLTSRRNEAIVEVIDTGRGMKPDERQKVFDAYYSTKPGGTGLGLPTTRRIIREHHGTINVQSDPGKGTRFVISLPPSGS